MYQDNRCFMKTFSVKNDLMDIFICHHLINSGFYIYLTEQISF